MKQENTVEITTENASEHAPEATRHEHVRNVADLFVECLVNEGVHVIYGIPGEENIPLMEALERDGRIRFVLTRHVSGERTSWPSRKAISPANQVSAWPRSDRAH